jgi:Flp pilus assembly protein TadG
MTRSSLYPISPLSSPASSLLRRFRRSRDGATAVEFGIVAMPFFAFLMGVLELALSFWSTQVLETAVANASRQIYTGQFQQDPNNAGLTSAQLQAKFKTLVCNNVQALFRCNNLVSVDVRRVANFNDANLAAPINTQTQQYDPSGYGYNPPGRLELAVVRASLEYPVYVTRMGYINVGGGTGLASGNRLIVASAVFRTEPY